MSRRKTAPRHPDTAMDISAGICQELIEITLYRVSIPNDGAPGHTDYWKMSVQASAKSDKTQQLVTVAEDWATDRTLDGCLAKIRPEPEAEIGMLF